MPETDPPAPRRRGGRWWQRLLAATLAAAMLVAAALVLLPTLVSTEGVRRLLERATSTALRCPVHIDGLQWGWRGALVVEGIRLEDGPAFSSQPLAALRRAELRVHWRDLLARRFSFDLIADGLSASYVRAADGATNWGTFLARLPPKKVREGPIRLPLEGAARIRLTGIELSADDRRTDRKAGIRSGAITLEAPSLRTAPVSVSLGARAEANGHDLSPVSLTARAAGLLDHEGVLHPLATVAEASGGLPGTRLAFRADLPRGAASARLDLDLARFVEAFGPFLPSAASAAEAGGFLSLRVDAEGDPKRSLPFRMTLAGDGLRAAGGVLGRASAGPLRLTADARGRVLPGESRVTVEAGEVRLQEHTRLGWRGTYLWAPDGASLSAEAAPVALDLGELLALARPFSTAARDLELGGATLDATRLRWNDPRGPGPISAEGRGLLLRVASLRRRAGPQTLRGQGLRFDVPQADVVLAAGFPSRAEVTAALRARALSVAGPGAFSLEGMEVPSLHAVARGIERRRDGPFGFTGRLSLRESVAVRRFDGTPIQSVRGLRHDLSAQISFEPRRAVDVRVASLGLAAQTVTARGGGDAAVGLRRGTAARSAELRVTGARFSGPLTNGSNPVRAERIALTISAAAGGWGPSRFSAHGLRLSVRDAVGGLRRGFPESAGFTAVVGAGSAQWDGRRRARVSALSVPRLGVAVSGLQRSAKTPLGFSGRFSVRQVLDLGDLWVEGRGAARALHQELDAEGRLGAEPQMRVRKFRLDADSLTVDDPRAGRSRLPVSLDASAERLVLRGVAPMRADALDAKVRLEASDVFKMDLAASASDLGRENLSTSGRLDANLSGVPRGLLALARKGLRLGGNVGLLWDVTGRLPSATEAGTLGRVRAPPQSLPLPLAFAGRADVTATLSGASIHLPVDGGRSLSLAGVSTPRPVHLLVERQGERARVDGSLRAQVVEEIPGLAPFDLPPRASLDVTAEQEGQRSIKVSEILVVDPLGLRQTMVADVAGVDRILRQGLFTPSALWVRALDGTVRASLEAGKGVGVVRLGRDMSWNGPLAALAEVRLHRDRDVEARLKVDSTGLDAQVGELLTLRRFRSNLDLSKRYALVEGQGLAPAAARRPLLSHAVLEAPQAAIQGGDDRSLRMLSTDLGRQFRGTPSLACDHASVRVGGRRIAFERGAVDLRLDGGLPVVDRLQVDVLGGSVIGSASVGAPGEGFPLRARLAFSGLDPGRVVPGLSASTSGDGAVSAQAALTAPLSRGSEALLSDLDLQLDLTRIGPHALGRLLLALDPTGGNDALAKQRRLVQTGTPRWVHVAVRRGNLSLGGEVEAKGFRFAIPPVDRLNVSELPLRERIDRGLAGLAPALEALRTLAASGIVIGSDGDVRLNPR